MKTIASGIVCAALLTMSGVAMSSGSPVSGTGILEIGSYSQNRIFVKTATLINPASCTGATFALDKNDDNFDEMYSALLAAMMGPGRVNLRISNTTCVDEDPDNPNKAAYPKIIYVGVTPS